MKAAVAQTLRIGRAWVTPREVLDRLDRPLVAATAALLLLGLVMVASASMPLAARATGDPFHYFLRQLGYALAGVTGAGIVLQIPLATWERLGFTLMALALFSLLIVLLPGVGRTTNGSTRWLDLGLIRVQVSEPARLMLLLYLAGYLVRRHQEVRESVQGFVKPMLVLSLACLLMLMEPDFGAASVLLATALVMLYVAGVRMWQFIALFSLSLAAMMLLVWSSPYRMQRLTGFLNPWQDPFSTGFQLTQSLIAIGSGHWFGVGLGSSVQKMFYLPEAYTDFLFAVLAEELGLLGTLAVIALYGVVVWRGMAIAARAARLQRWFAAYLAQGLSAWIGLQAFINIGVNMGLLPTKGLTLPLMSYGGSSLLTTCVLTGLLLRVEVENRASVEGQV